MQASYGGLKDPAGREYAAPFPKGHEGGASGWRPGRRRGSCTCFVPGMHHCSGGPGVDSFDMLTALEQWVERGVTPERIVASRVVDGATVRSRPL